MDIRITAATIAASLFLLGEGGMARAGSPPGKAPEPNAKPSGASHVTCCLPVDDGGAQCDERTPERCALEGGTIPKTDGCLAAACGAPA